MQKEARMRAQAELAKKETLAATASQLEKAGLNFVNHELPPDEVDEKEVEQSTWTSIKTFIPYTNEWWEARRAEEEMDALNKIRVEKIKANDLVVMTKTGRAEEALAKMMAETNNDFFFFNKLKYKMEQEGTFKYADPRKATDPFTAISRGAKTNRLKKAINTTLDSEDDMGDISSQLSRLKSRDSSTSAVRAKIGSDMMISDIDITCNWRGRDRSKNNLRCDNKRLIRRHRSNDKSGSSLPEMLPCCVYHTNYCTSDSHPINERVKIDIPNELALCSACYLSKKGMNCAALTPTMSPGVIPASLMVKQSIAAFNRSSSKKNETNDSSTTVIVTSNIQKSKLKNNECMWIPQPGNMKTRGYECVNKKHNGLETCLWHTMFCLRSHPNDKKNAVITIPNPLGLCAMHYLSEQGIPPPIVDIPFPGMIIKKSNDFWLKGRHFATPKKPPPEIIIPKPYKKFYPPIDFFGIIMDDIRRIKIYM